MKNISARRKSEKQYLFITISRKIRSRNTQFSHIARNQHADAASASRKISKILPDDLYTRIFVSAPPPQIFEYRARVARDSKHARRVTNFSKPRLQRCGASGFGFPFSAPADVKGASRNNGSR